MIRRKVRYHRCRLGPEAPLIRKLTFGRSLILAFRTSTLDALHAIDNFAKPTIRSQETPGSLSTPPDEGSSTFRFRSIRTSTPNVRDRTRYNEQATSVLAAANQDTLGGSRDYTLMTLAMQAGYGSQDCSDSHRGDVALHRPLPRDRCFGRGGKGPERCVPMTKATRSVIDQRLAGRTGHNTETQPVHRGSRRMRHGHRPRARF